MRANTDDKSVMDNDNPGGSLTKQTAIDRSNSVISDDDYKKKYARDTENLNNFYTTHY